MMTYIPVQNKTFETTLTAARLVSITVRVPFVDGLTFLRQAPPDARRIYWENDRLKWRYAGFGTAAEVTAKGSQRFAEVKADLEKLFADLTCKASPGTPPEALPRIFGGFAFRPNAYPDDNPGIWSDFPDAGFLLPQVLLASCERDAWLTVSTFTNQETSAVFERLQSDANALAAGLINRHESAQRASTPELVNFSDPLTRDRWHTEITEATNRIKTGDLDKVVLARICDLDFDQTVDPLSALENLQQRYADTYRFLIEMQPHRFFFGATPELLVSKQANHLMTAALAGSTQRGENPAEDDRMAAQLFQSAKERHEHQLVVMAIEDALLPLTTKLDVPESPQILKLSNIQHLYTPITGMLKERQTLLDAVEKLHPTPAVGGYPRQTAVDLIDSIEQFPRGWYASPVGWIDAQGNGMFAVALRSAVVKDHQARSYAGVGIVADSDPGREWDETNLKFRPMLNAFGIES